MSADAGSLEIIVDMVWVGLISLFFLVTLVFVGSLEQLRDNR